MNLKVTIIDFDTFDIREPLFVKKLIKKILEIR